VKHVLGVVESAAALLLAAVVLIVLAQVVARYVLHVPISWPEELARYVAVWMTFLGVAAAAGSGGQITVDTLPVLAPPRAKTILKLLAAIGGLAAIVILIDSARPLFGAPSRTVSPGSGDRDVLDLPGAAHWRGIDAAFPGARLVAVSQGGTA